MNGMMKLIRCVTCIAIAIVVATGLMPKPAAVMLDAKYVAKADELIESMETSKETQKKAAQMAALARDLGLAEDSETIQHAQRVWAQEKNNIVNCDAELESAMEVTFNYYVGTPTGLSAEAFNVMLEGTAMEGSGQAFADIESTYNVNGVLAIGVAMTESSIGRHCAYNNPYGMLRNGKLIQYSSWYDSTMAFGSLMSRLYKGHSVYTMSNKYCPTNPMWSGEVKFGMDLMYNKIQA